MKDVLFKWFTIVLIFIFLILMFLLFRIFSNEKSIGKEIKKILSDTNIEELVSGSLISIDSSIESDYWKYINEKSINVNFDKLKKYNDDIVGWIRIEGTNVNYPYVKSDNNNFYLKHSINRKSNHIGWTFEDSDVTGNNNNMVLYNYSNKTLLASATDVLNKKWFSNNNHIIKTSTLFENDLWQIFSIYKTSNIDDIKIQYDNLVDYTESMKEKSIYKFDINLDNVVKILTFITRDDNEYVVIHAKMIKQQKR